MQLNIVKHVNGSSVSISVNNPENKYFRHYWLYHNGKEYQYEFDGGKKHASGFEMADILVDDMKKNGFALNNLEKRKLHKTLVSF